jgi:hypothetical protein
LNLSFFPPSKSTGNFADKIASGYIVEKYSVRSPMPDSIPKI